LIALTSISTVEAVKLRSGRNTAVLSIDDATRTRWAMSAIPVVLLPDCDLTDVEDLSLFGPFDTWREQVAQLSLQVRGQIRRLSLNSSRAPVRTEEVNRDLPRLQYLNRCADEPGIDLSVFQLFPELREVAFNWVRNFDVNQFTAIDWPNIRRFEFPYMRIGGNTDWLRHLQAPNLEVLDLAGNILSDLQIEEISADFNRRCPALQTIEVDPEDAFEFGEYENEYGARMRQFGNENYTPEIRWEDFPQDSEEDEESYSSRVSSNRSDSSENESESESRNGVSHRSSSDRDQESGSEN
jgi:hypothetical protein